VKRYEQAVASVARKFGLQISRLTSPMDRLPSDADPAFASVIAGLRPYTMTSAARIWSLTQAVRYLEAEGIAGDFVECGVWRGGSVMAMAQALAEGGSHDRRIWLYDTFQGMTEPSEHDVEAGSGVHAEQMLATTEIGDGRNVWCVASRGDVEANLRTLDYPFEQFTFVEGDVAETLKDSVPDSIALLRLDTDWYESTRKSLEVLYPKLAVGGICILDDYGHWEGARKAVDEYFDSLPSRPLLMPLDYSGRMFFKPPSHAHIT
jgi:O-methyltransferase